MENLFHEAKPFPNNIGGTPLPNYTRVWPRSAYRLKHRLAQKYSDWDLDYASIRQVPMEIQNLDKTITSFYKLGYTDKDPFRNTLFWNRWSMTLLSFLHDNLHLFHDLLAVSRFISSAGKSTTDDKFKLLKHLVPLCNPIFLFIRPIYVYLFRF